MKSCLRIVLLLVLVSGTLTQDDFDLTDAIDVTTTTPAKPKEQPKAPEKPKADDPKTKPVNPPKSGGGGFEFNLEDAVHPDPNPKPDKPIVNQPESGGGGEAFNDLDLLDGIDGDKHDGGRSGGRAVDPNINPQGGADQPQEAGSGQIAGIASAIGVALLGAASSYFAYQKKKLCFKIQGGADPESGKGQHGTQSDPQVFSELLRSSQTPSAHA